MELAGLEPATSLGAIQALSQLSIARGRSMVAALHRPSRGTVLVSLARGVRAVSFRNRLRLFFGLIVIVPMVALGFVLFALTARSETGKADAGIVAGGRAAVGLYREEVAQARARLRRIAHDRELRLAIASGRPADADRRLRRLASGRVRGRALVARG